MKAPCRITGMAVWHTGDFWKGYLTPTRIAHKHVRAVILLQLRRRLVRHTPQSWKPFRPQKLQAGWLLPLLLRLILTGRGWQGMQNPGWPLTPKSRQAVTVSCWHWLISWIHNLPHWARLWWRHTLALDCSWRACPAKGTRQAWLPP